MLSQYTKVIYLCCFNNHTGYIKKLSWLKPPFNSQLNHTFGFPFSCIICQAWESIISVRVTDLAVRSTQQPRYFSQCTTERENLRAMLLQVGYYLFHSLDRPCPCLLIIPPFNFHIPKQTVTQHWIINHTRGHYL